MRAGRGRAQARGGAWPLLAAVLACGLAACSFTSLDELQEGEGSPSSAGSGGGNEAPTSSTSSSSVSGSGGASSSTGGGAGGEGSGGGGDTGGGGGGGAGGPALVDTGLLVRYFVDDAAEGTTQTTLTDAAPVPLDLSIQFDPFDEGMEWVSESGHRGLHWSTADGEGIASMPTAKTKVRSLDQSVFGTIEVVARIELATITGSRLLHVGSGSDSGFTLAVAHVDEVNEIAPPTRLQMRTRADSGDPLAPIFRYGYFDLEIAPVRVVIHAVFDSRETAPEDRIRMYLDGVRLLPSPDENPPPPEENEEIYLETEDVLAIGNRLIGDRSIGGTIFYGAIYLAPLTDAEIAQNAASLAVRDDR